MDQSETDGQNREMPPEDNSSRHIPLPACVTSGFASVISIFFIGLAAGAVGGVLLGGTAVAVLQSLELLADNKLLMDQLEEYIMEDYNLERKAKELLQWESYNQAHEIQISSVAEIFGIASSAFSIVGGILMGWSTYSLVIKTKGEAAMGKALALAGTVYFTVVILIGYLLGLAFGSFLSVTLKDSIVFWCCVVVCVIALCIVPVFVFSIFCFLIPGAALITFLLCFLSKSRIILVVSCIPLILVVKLSKTSYSRKLTTATVPLMLTISDIYNVSGWQIVSLQSPTSTNTSSTVIEAIFVGVLTSQLLTVTVGMLLFVSWQRGGAAKICASAAASGGAALTAIKFGLPVLGPGPTIGALMGVAGAVGVSLSAAGEATDQYGKEKGHYGLVGRLGVTLGAAFGAFLYSCSHSGLSAVFMGLCAATIPAEIFLKPPFLHSTLRNLFVGLWICMIYVFIMINHTPLLYIMSLTKFEMWSLRSSAKTKS